MLIEEAQWIKQILQSEFTTDDFPMLNVGSSSEGFRKNTQPHIHELIFKPLLDREARVYHADIKQDDGVELVGDLNDPEFRQKLAELEIKSVLCSNLLEHLKDPQLICDSIMDLLNSGDKLIVTVPHQFPFHKDPIDTMLRPGVKELEKMFPEMETIKSEITVADRCYLDDLKANKRYFLIMCFRWCMPFYKYSEWKYMIKDLFRWRKKYSATAVYFRKR